jgi:hypothetical protein
MPEGGLMLYNDTDHRQCATVDMQGLDCAGPQGHEGPHANAFQKEWLEAAILRANTQGERFRLGFDPIDNSMKWKVGLGAWSPPVKTEEM